MDNSPLSEWEFLTFRKWHVINVKDFSALHRLCNPLSMAVLPSVSSEHAPYDNCFLQIGSGGHDERAGQS